jgi:hypothetical protein
MSETLALDAAWIFAVFLVVVVLAAAAIAGRRILLDRGGGTVECELRRPGGTWRLGVAAYGADELRWYNGVGVLLTPEEVLSRRALSITSRGGRKQLAAASSPRDHGWPEIPEARGHSPAAISAFPSATRIAQRGLAGPHDG